MCDRSYRGVILKVIIDDFNKVFINLRTVFLDVVIEDFNKLFYLLMGVYFWLSIFIFLLKVVFIIIIVSIVIKISKKIIERVLSNNKKTAIRITKRREDTLRKLIENALVYVVYSIVILMILDTVGIPIATLLAGAGVIGLAIGFGAQSLVQDVISGFFIVFED